MRGGSIIRGQLNCRLELLGSRLLFGLFHIIDYIYGRFLRKDWYFSRQGITEILSLTSV